MSVGKICFRLALSAIQLFNASVFSFAAVATFVVVIFFLFYFIFAFRNLTGDFYAQSENW